MKKIEIVEGVVITPETTAEEVAKMITETWMTEYHLHMLIHLYGVFQAKRVKDEASTIVLSTKHEEDVLIMINRIKL